MVFSVGSLYAGVGGIDEGMKQAKFDIAWANEYDKYACETYRLNHPNSILIEDDIHQVDISNLTPVDILTAGFPCQPFSSAGYRKGFDDERGNHFYRIMEVVDILEPSVLFLENVKNFKNHDDGNTFAVVEEAIKSRGYWFHDDILNTCEYADIPQNRERFFLVAFSDQEHYQNFKFPDQISLTTTIHDFIDKGRLQDNFYYTPDSTIIYDRMVGDIDNPDTVYQWRRQYVRENKNNMCPTLTANMGTGGHNVPIILTPDGIRKFTPQECFRFQGYTNILLPDDMSNTQLYKQAGNSVTVKVIKRIADNIMTVLTGRKVESSNPSEPAQLKFFDTISE